MSKNGSLWPSTPSCAKRLHMRCRLACAGRIHKPERLIGEGAGKLQNGRKNCRRGVSVPFLISYLPVSASRLPFPALVFRFRYPISPFPPHVSHFPPSSPVSAPAPPSPTRQFRHAIASHWPAPAAEPHFPRPHHPPFLALRSHIYNRGMARRQNGQTYAQNTGIIEDQKLPERDGELLR